MTRSALGASRGRLILQLFAEALVLTSTAAVLGLGAAAWGMKRGMEFFWKAQQSRPPFWVESSLSTSTILYTLTLAVFGAVLVGAVPALKVTGRNLRSGFRSAGAEGSRLRFGAASRGMIIVQVALSVVFLPIAVVRGQDALGDRIESIGFPADEYLTGRLTNEAEVQLGGTSDALREDFLARMAELQDEVRRRLASEPGISGATFASRLPGMNHPYERVQAEGDVALADSPMGSAARVLSVDLTFFEVMEAPIVSGRGFQAADLVSEIGVAIVDESFVRENLAGRNPVGERIRYPQRPNEEGERWYEVVGVVQDLAMNSYGPGGYQDLIQTGPASYVGVYHPLRPGANASVQLFLRAEPSGPDVIVPRIAATITSLDPSLAIHDLMPLEEVWRPVHQGERLLTWIMAFVAGIVVVLSAAGIYALVSFTVSQRTREIGIRTALGADPGRIIVTIFSRVLMQMGAGVLIGGLAFGLAAGIDTLERAWVVVAMAALMMGVGLLACALPARRALRIEPTEALRLDA